MAKRKKPLDEQGQDNENDNVNDDSFGLPDLDYKPLESTPPAEEKTTIKSETIEEKKEEVKSEPVVQQTTYTSEVKKETQPTSTYRSSYMEEEENKSKAPVMIGVIVAVALVVVAGLFYFFIYKPQQAEKARKELAAQEEKARLEQELRDRQAAEEAARKRIADSLALVNAKPKEGTIETLTDRTKRYYVVVTSAIDGDLVMDKAKKLSAKGISTKIIPPFGKYKFSRLAIGDFDTFANAQASADAAKGEYGGAVWVLKF